MHRHTKLLYPSQVVLIKLSPDILGKVTQKVNDFGAVSNLQACIGPSIGLDVKAHSCRLPIQDVRCYPLNAGQM